MSCWRIWLLRSRSRSQCRFSMLVNDCPNDIIWSAEHFVTKFGIMMQHHEPECNVETKLVCYLQGQGHSKGSCDQNMTFPTISSELLTFWQPNLVWWYIIISQSVFWKKERKKDYCIRGQGHSKGPKCPCLSIWHLLLKCQIFCC